MYLIGSGRTAKVYDDNGKALKVFNDNYPKEAIYKEYSNASLMKAYLPHNTPKVHMITLFQKNLGILFDKIEGLRFTDLLLRSKNISKVMSSMVKLHKKILKNKISSDIHSYKTLLYLRTQDQSITKQIDELPDGNNLLHGDFHPDNLIMRRSRLYVVDFANISRGPKLADIANTYYLISAGKLSDDLTKEEIDAANNQRVALANSYLMAMKYSYNDIKPFLNVLTKLDACTN